MKPEYDFQHAVRGKFFRPDAALRIPVYLEPEVLEFLAAKAEEKGVGLDEIANELLKKDIGSVRKVD
jgi:hypothetical protein